MRASLLRISVFMVLLCSGTTVWSQSIWNQVLGTVGGQGTVSGNTISFTAGEVISGTAPLAVVKLSQGFHQTMPGVTVGVTSATDQHLSIALYPNPTSQEVTISVADDDEILTLGIFDVTGKQLQTQMLTASTTQINLSAFASGVYIFHISGIKGIQTHITRVQKIN
jgi:hypothetical protein